MSYPNAERFLQSNDAFCQRAVDTFRRDVPEGRELLAHAGDLVASLTFFLSGRDVGAIANGLYIGDLIVSFCRSHFVAAELLERAQLIEFAAVARKQIELLARLHELEKFDVANLERKTPNIRHLPENIRRLYPEYSRLTHSADPESIQLLGHLVVDSKLHTPLFPEFQANVLVAVNHIGLIALGFATVATKFHAKHFPDYDPTYDAERFRNVLTLLTSERLAETAQQSRQAVDP